MLSDVPLDKGKVNNIFPVTDPTLNKVIDTRLTELENRMTGIHNVLEKLTANFATTSPQTQNHFSTCKQFPEITSLGIRKGPRILKTDLGHDQSRSAPSAHLLSMTDSTVSSAPYHKKCAVSTTPDKRCAFGTDNCDKVVGNNSNFNSVDSSKALNRSKSTLVSRSKQLFSPIHSIVFFTKVLFFILLGLLLLPATIDSKSVQSIKGKCHVSGTMVLGLSAIRIVLSFISFCIALSAVSCPKLNRHRVISSYLWYCVERLRRILFLS